MGNAPSFPKSGIHGAAHSPLLPDASVGEDILIIIIQLCETVNLNRNAARYIARRCENLCNSLRQDEELPVPFPKRTVKYRDNVFRCLNEVKDTMTKWAEKSWIYMLEHQADFKADLDGCDRGISGCLLIFSTAVHMEQQEEDEQRRNLEEMHDVDRRDMINQFASPNFVQQVEDSGITEDDRRMVLTMIQTSLWTVPDEECKRMAENLYELLRPSGRIPPECQLNSKVVEWAGERPMDGGNKGRYLNSQDVRIKVIHSNMRDEKNVNRIRREVQTWADIYRKDKGKHIVPFYGFYSPDDLRLALVSPWMDNGNALSFVKKWDGFKEIDYKKLILGIAEGVEVIHSMSIIHGNLRAENVLIGDEGQPLITDFALAKLEGRLNDTFVSLSDSYRWCAPEIFKIQGAVSAKSDIYSFGMTILELFTHEMPYPDVKKSTQVVYKKLYGELPQCPIDNHIIKRGLDDKMWKLLCRCWFNSPNDRPSMRQIVKEAALQSLLATLKKTAPLSGTMVDKNTLRLICEALFVLGEEVDISRLTTMDVKLMLDYLLHLLRDGKLSNSNMQDANEKARKLLFKLISVTDALPISLFITDVRTKIGLMLGANERGGSTGQVYKGEYRGQEVMLKALHKGRKDLLGRCFYHREALAWASLVHRYILPLLGIFEEKSYSFLVLPYMTNGTLRQWRKVESPLPLVEVHRLMQEVAEGVRYIHSEEIVHGDLHGDNIYVDADFHCQIADPGLTWHSSVTDTRSNMQKLYFATPELFTLCNKCCQYGCNGRCEDYDDASQEGKKTMQADVYSFGCLYYAIFFDTVPFQGKNECQLAQPMKSGTRPVRLNNPVMDDHFWSLMERCWMPDPFARPTMEEIAMIFESLSLPSMSLPEALSSLLATLRKEDAVCRMSKLLNLYDTHAIASKLRNKSDAEVMLVLDILLNGSLNANRKARRLMFHLISESNLIPRSLFITDVTVERHLGSIGRGGFGRVFRGIYKGQQVAVKVVEKGHNDNSLIKDFSQEALAWRSLSHRFILPLLGIYEEKLQLSLVSPFMENGTLNKWRKKCTPDVAEVHRLMLEVAEGVQYIHSEGVVHGDLHGGNVLLDSELHCKITDFGLTRHAEATFTRSTRTFLPNFAAPELFGMCTECGEPECAGCYEGHDEHHTGKTMETDVYAFGCLYYAVFFDVVPFHGKSDYQIMGLVTRGVRPARLDSPIIDDVTWNLITSSWARKPSERPTMDESVKIMKSSSELSQA